MKKFIAFLLAFTLICPTCNAVEGDYEVSDNIEISGIEDVMETEPALNTENMSEVVEDAEITLNSEDADIQLSSTDVVDSGRCGTNLTWELTNDGTLTISGTGDMYKFLFVSDGTGYGAVSTAPWIKYRSQITKLIFNPGITGISDFAFHDCGEITGDIVIPDGVTKINRYAFTNCCKINSLSIPQSTSYISSEACMFSGSIDFIVSNNNPYYCSMNGVLFSKDKTVLVSYAKDKKQSEYTIPYGVKIIEEYAFRDCSGLKCNMPIPDTVTEIRNNAFSSCTNLTGDLIIPDSVTYMGRDAFFACGFNGKLKISANITHIYGRTFYGCNKFECDVVIPEGVTDIDDLAFASCSKMASVTIPNTVTSIGDAAFGISSTGSIYGSGAMKGPVYIDCLPGYRNMSDENYDRIIYYNKSKAQYLQDMSITEIDDVYYTGQPIKPKVSVCVKNKMTDEVIAELTEGTDYIVSYSNNTAIGTATANISYIGNYSDYTGAVNSINFEITKTPISAASMTNIYAQRFTGSETKPEPYFTYAGHLLQKGTDYMFSYENNVNAGRQTATLTVIGMGIFDGSIQHQFTILPKSGDSVYIAPISNQIYTGNSITPDVDVIDQDR